MSRYYNQSRSQCNQGGEPTSHTTACNNIDQCATARGYKVYQKYPVDIPPFGYWELDLVIFPYAVYIDRPSLLNAKAIVEVGWKGDDSRHNKTRGPQAVKDSIVSGWCKDNYPDVDFKRINKDDTIPEYWDWLSRELKL